MNRACFRNATKRKRSHERSELNLSENRDELTACRTGGHPAFLKQIIFG